MYRATCIKVPADIPFIVQHIHVAVSYPEQYFVVTIIINIKCIYIKDGFASIVAPFELPVFTQHINIAIL